MLGERNRGKGRRRRIWRKVEEESERRERKSR